MIRNRKRNNASVLVVVIFAIALLSALVAGLLQLDCEQIKLMSNEVFSAQASAIAQAGLADAFSQLRTDSGWTDGFSSKAFADGSYSVAVEGVLPNLVITSTGISSQNFICRFQAQITVGTSQPYAIRVDKLRINE